jgi:hypothetical protein
MLHLRMTRPRKVMEMKFTLYISTTQMIQLMQPTSQLLIMFHLLIQPLAALRKMLRFKTKAPLRTRLPKGVTKEDKTMRKNRTRESNLNL